MKTKSLIGISDACIRVLIKMRAKNQRFGEDITQIRVMERNGYKFSTTVYCKRYAPETHSIDLRSRMFANEFLFLQKMGFDLTELILK